MNRLNQPTDPRRTEAYDFHAPSATHRRAATCDEVDCLRYRTGWLTAIDESDSAGQVRAGYIRRDSGRSFAEFACTGGEVTVLDWHEIASHEIDVARIPYREGVTVFAFPPGQKCFMPHSTRLDKPEIFTVRIGGALRRRVDGAEWVERSQETLTGLKELHERERGP